MRWTRMHDGSHISVKTTYGRTLTYKLMRGFAGRGEKSTLWSLYVNGIYLPNDKGPEGCTFRGAKERADRHFYEQAKQALLERKAKEGKPLIDIL